MKYTISLLYFISLIFVGCVEPPTPSERLQQEQWSSRLTYRTDTRTHLCFAVFTSTTYSPTFPKQVQSIANVPLGVCDQMNPGNK